MAQVLHSQWSTSTVDWDDFYTSLGSTCKLKHCRTTTSKKCSRGDGEGSTAPRTPSPGSTTGMVDLLLDDVYNVICELYQEEIFPTLHEIRRRLQRNHSALVDAKWLLKICTNDSYHRFQVINLDETSDNQHTVDVQRGVAITLADKPKAILEAPPLDPLDLIYVFKCAVMLASAKACEKTEQGKLCTSKRSDRHVTRIGGRYLFAEYLRKAGPKHFRKKPLGRLMHLVQAALDAKILVYQDNTIVPAVSSSTAARLFLDRLEKKNSSTSSLRQRYMQQLKQNIIALLRDKPAQLSSSSPDKLRKGPRAGLVITLKASGDCVSLCKLPSLYKQKYKEDLDYGAVGYLKLADFIQSELPECTVERCDRDKTYGKQPDYYPKISGTIKDFFYIPSTTLLFPLAMTTSRVTASAAQCLLSNW